MIPRSAKASHGLRLASAAHADPDSTAFAEKIPAAFRARIDPRDPDDPLARQVFLHADERLPAMGFTSDPVGDLEAGVGPGVIHKYSGRVLLIATGACAIHCRYCFRRHYPYGEQTASRDDWVAALRYLEEHPDVSEVILSGGDPLTLSVRRLRTLTEGLNQIAHIRRLRIHTRLPIADPGAVARSGIVSWLAGVALQRVVVVHVNHPNELDAHTDEVFTQLRDAGVTLLNQSVLLAGVNDSAPVLSALSERLFAAGALPYYLHQLDRAQGTAHFAVCDQIAREIMHALRSQLSGFLVPRLVREAAGAPYKLPLL